VLFAWGRLVGYRDLMACNRKLEYNGIVDI
jgi:hypothetical protein